MSRLLESGQCFIPPVERRQDFASQKETMARAEPLAPAVHRPKGSLRIAGQGTRTRDDRHLTAVFRLLRLRKRVEKGPRFLGMPLSQEQACRLQR
jgi:hypothetical protein